MALASAAVPSFARRVDAAVMKAATLLMPASPKRGYWMGDPVSNGLWVDASRYGAWRGTGAFDYGRAVGDPMGSSLVMAILNAITAAMPEPPLRVYKPNAEGEEEAVKKHPAELLWRRPNKYLTAELLSIYVAIAQHIDGNAYLWKQRSGGGRVVELWPISPHLISPAWPDDATTRTWITHYAYKPDTRAEAIRLPPEDVVHLRLNLDPQNMRKGRSPLAAVLAEIFTDQEATAFLAALLRNYGIPPVLLAPDVRAGSSPSPEQLMQAKDEIKQRLGGEMRGDVMVTAAPWVATKVGYSPADMNLDRLHALPETRVSGALGVPAIVAHLLVGLEHGTYSNADQLREQFAEGKMVPYWRLVAADLTRQLLPDFESDEDAVMRFDLQDVRALQEDMDSKYTRVLNAYGKGLVTMNTGLRELGFPELGDDGDVLLIPNTVTVTKPEDLIAEPEPEPLPMALPPAAGAPQLPGPPGPSGPQARVTEVAPARMTPPAQATRSMKAAVGRDFAPRVHRARARLTAAAQKDLTRFFREQAERAAKRAMSIPGIGAREKQIRHVPSSDVLPDDLEQRLLGAVLEGYYLRALSSAHELTQDALGFAFELDDPTTRRYLTQSGEAIVGISDTTKTAVRESLLAGQREGENLQQLAKRIRDLPEFSPKRAMLVARTEMATASNRAASYSYQASGVVRGIEIADQESDPQCEGWNGRRFTMEQVEAGDVPHLLHPNCSMAWLPLVGGEA